MLGFREEGLSDLTQGHLWSMEGTTAFPPSLWSLVLPLPAWLYCSEMANAVECGSRKEPLSSVLRVLTGTACCQSGPEYFSSTQWGEILWTPPPLTGAVDSSEHHHIFGPKLSSRNGCFHRVQSGQLKRHFQDSVTKWWRRRAQIKGLGKPQESPSALTLPLTGKVVQMILNSEGPRFFPAKIRLTLSTQR